MKIAAIIFTILGIFANFALGADYTWLALIGVGVGIWMIATLATNKKSTAAGIFGIIFTGLLGGIFYLCWKPEEETK